MQSSKNAKTPESLVLGDKANKDYRQMCKYGKECYQKNPMHHQKFKHPTSVEQEVKDSKKRPLLDDSDDHGKSPVPVKVAKSEADGLNEEAANPTQTPDSKSNSEDSTVALDEILDEDSDILPPQEEWPKDPVLNFQQKFLVKMPPDFFAFWDFCLLINRSNPREAILETAGLRLVGPFDLLPESKASFKTRKLNDFLCHWRYYYDPPEFQTVLASDTSNFHIGYFRDSPNDATSEFLASATGDDCRLSPLGDNLFGALYNYLGALSLRSDPFKQAAIQKLRQSIHSHATMKNQDESYCLDVKTQHMKNRDKLRLGSVFHGSGMVVSYNKKTEVGYRPVPTTQAKLKKMFSTIVSTADAVLETKNKAFDELQELITNVQFANDEGDFGMGLELGLNAFLFGGKPLESATKVLLNNAYDLLDREIFAKILNAHLLRRREVFKAE